MSEISQPPIISEGLNTQANQVIEAGEMSSASLAQKKYNWLMPVGAVALLLILIGGGVWWYQGTLTKQPVVSKSAEEMNNLGIAQSDEKNEDLSEELITFTSKKLGSKPDGYSITYPVSWKGIDPAPSLEDSAAFDISRGDYTLSFNRWSEGENCNFEDAPYTDGPVDGPGVIDLRGVKYTKIETEFGELRRYIHQEKNEDGFVVFSFCGFNPISKFYGTPIRPTNIDVSYSVPANYDEQVLKEMDEIVKTLTISTESWKTYTNSKIGARIKYPSDWLLKEDANSNAALFNTMIGSSVKIWEGTEENYSFDFYVMDSGSFQFAIGQMKKLRSMTVNNFQFDRYISEDALFSLNHYYKSDDGRVFAFSLWPYTQAEEPTVLDDIITKILSTFEVTD